MSIVSYRQQEIEKIINSIFIQFQITNEEEKKKLRSDLLIQMKATGPLLSYKNNTGASSKAFRNDVRSFMVDATAHLLALQDIERDLKGIESESRDMISFGNTKVAAIEKEAASSSKSGRVINETFNEASFTGTHAGTTVKDGYLRLDNSGRQPQLKISNLKINVLPAKSLQNGINIITNGDLNSIFGTGIGSDNYWTILSTINEPVIEYIPEKGHYEKLRGIITEIEFTTDKYINPVNISAKFSTASRIYRVFASSTGEEEWYGLADANDTLCEDKTEGLYSLIDNAANTTSYNRFKIIIHTPTYTTEKNGKKYYRIGMYNLKLLEDRDSLTGIFKSNKYINKDQVFKVNIDSLERRADSVLNGASLYTVNFNLGNKSLDFPVIPTGNVTVINSSEKIIEGLILKPSYSDHTYNYYITPFPRNGLAHFSVHTEGVGSSALIWGLEINGELVGGTDSSVFKTSKAGIPERLCLTYDIQDPHPFLYYYEELNANTTESPHEVRLSTEINSNFINYDSMRYKILRCSEELWTTVDSSENEIYIVRYSENA